MSASKTICLLCGHSATAESTNHGNRMYIACANPLCGDYEVSHRAAKEIENAAGRKEALREMAMRANQAGKILDVSIASDGQLQAMMVSHS